MSKFYTSGQVARRLRISVSTLKRWLDDPSLSVSEQRNCNGWRLFSEADLNALNHFKKLIRKNGKQFNETVLIPVVQKHQRHEPLVASYKGIEP
jgi:DNA-binding transcriptional MerR regulator